MPIEMLYLVMASSGTYDMHEKWVVAAVMSLAEAETYCSLATDASKQSIAAYKRSPEGADREFMYFTAPTKYDLAHRVNDTEPRYYIEPVPLVPGLLDSRGLLPAAGAYASAVAVTLESNRPGISQRLRKPQPTPAVVIQGDFASKLKSALAA